MNGFKATISWQKPEETKRNTNTVATGTVWVWHCMGRACEHAHAIHMAFKRATGVAVVPLLWSMTPVLQPLFLLLPLCLLAEQGIHLC